MSGAFEKAAILPKNMLDKRKTAREILDGFDTKIEGRITYILNVLYATFGSQLDTWCFQEGDGIDYMENDGEEIFAIEANPMSNVPSPALILDGELWEFYGGLPMRWLFEDCEKEIMEGRKEWEKQYGKSIQDQKSALEKKKKAALAKLTKEERKLLDV